jgi:hypothetical protein
MKIAAGLVFLTLLISTFAIVEQVSAHYTLGHQGVSGPEAPMGDPTNTWTLPPTIPDSHVSQSYAPANGYTNNHIAYISPGLNYRPLSTQQNYYSPDGAILVDTTGSLNFYLNISKPANFSNPAQPGLDISWEKHNGRARWLYIAIPPEFTPVADTPSKWRVVTSITNDYRFISTGKFDQYHPFAPNWWYIQISAPNVTDPTTKKSSNYLYEAGQDPFKDRQPYRQPDWRWGMYEIIAHDLKAPSCAGKYFFKIFYTKTLLFDLYEQYESIPPENYPELVVKGEVDPGYITGTVRYAGHSSYYYGSYYGTGIHTPGKVWANGTALDPVTDQPIQRNVCGVGYFNATAEGYYEIEGLAPGIYTLTACAAGFVPRTLATQITIKRGQSMHGVDIYLDPSPKLNITIYSKCPTGPVNWPDYTTLGVRSKPGRAGLGEVGRQLATLSPPNPQPLKGWPWAYYVVELFNMNGTRLRWRDGFFDISANPRTFTVFLGNPICYSGIETQWDGHIPDANAHFSCGISPSQYLFKAWVFGYYPARGSLQVNFPEAEFSGGVQYQEMDIFKCGTINATVHFHDQELPSDDVAQNLDSPFIVEAVDSYGKVQAWNLTDVKQGTAGATPRSQTLSLQLLGYGTEPMKRKTPPHGMPEGTYDIKAYYIGYVQQEFPPQTVQYCTNGSLSFHLVKGANITVTVYSRDCQDPSQPVNWLHPPSPLRVYVYNSNGEWAAGGYYDQTNQVAGADRVTFTGTLSLVGHKPGSADYFRGENRPTGLPTDVYTLRAYTVGYIQQQIPEVWTQKGSSAGGIPLYLLTGAEIDVVLDFKKELIPSPLPNDVHSFQFRIHAYDANGTLIAANITGVPVNTSTTVSQYPWSGNLNPAQPSGVQSWVFQLFGFGEFTSPENRLVTNGPGTTSASALAGGGLFYKYKTTFPGLYRKRFGYYSTFAKYPGLPKDRYVGDYRDYGIPPGTYTIVAQAEYPDYPGRYIQLQTVTTTPTCKGKTTVVFELDLLARISGFVYTRNWMGDFRSGSWIQTSAQGAKATTKTWGPTDGFYYTYVQPDTYTVTAELKPPGGEAGYKSQTRTTVTTWGGATGGQDFYLEESGIPIPEFPTTGLLAAISAVAAAIILLRKRNKAVASFGEH